MTAPIVFGPSGQGLAPLIQALQQRQQQQLQQQQLQTQQAVAQAQIARSDAETAATLAQTEHAARVAKGEADATKVFQEIVESGQEFTREVLFGALAKIKSSEGIMAFVRMVPNIGDLLSTPAKVRTAEAGATSAESRARVDTAAEPLTLERINQARDMLANPDAALPTDPTVGQAAALDMIGVLDAVLTQQRIAAQGESEDAQAQMLARQSSMQVTMQSLREFQEQAENIATGALEPEEAQTLDEILERNAQAVLGVSGAEVRRLNQSAIHDLQRRLSRGSGTPEGEDPSGFNASGLLSATQITKIRDVLDSDLFRGLARKEFLVEAAAFALGGATIDTEKMTSLERRLYNQLLRRLRQ